MKIDLDKDEWEFIRFSTTEYLDTYRSYSYPIINTNFEIVSKIDKKLGDEWKDEGNS